MSMSFCVRLTAAAPDCFPGDAPASNGYELPRFGGTPVASNAAGSLGRPGLSGHLLHLSSLKYLDKLESGQLPQCHATACRSALRGRYPPTLGGRSITAPCRGGQRTPGRRFPSLFVYLAFPALQSESSAAQQPHALPSPGAFTPPLNNRSTATRATRRRPVVSPPAHIVCSTQERRRYHTRHSRILLLLAPRVFYFSLFVICLFCLRQLHSRPDIHALFYCWARNQTHSARRAIGPDCIVGSPLAIYAQLTTGKQLGSVGGPLIGTSTRGSASPYLFMNTQHGI